MSLNFVFQSGIILKTFYAIRIKHAEIAYWNILAVIPECPSANWAVHLLVHFFVWPPLRWSTTFPFFRLNCFLNVHHCKTFLKASHDWDFSLFCFPLARPCLSLSWICLWAKTYPRFWAGCKVSQALSPSVCSHPREAQLNLVVR